MSLKMNKEVFITCAVTGSGSTQDRSPHVPRSPKQIADSAIAAAKAGAAVVHCHVRDPDSGVPSRKLSYYREVTERIRNGGVDVILNPSASHFAFGKDDIRRRFVQEGSRAFGAAYVYTNLLGNEAGRAIYDGGVIIASDGTIVAHGRRFSFTDMSIAESVIDVDALRVAQSKRSFAPSSENHRHR